VTSTTTAAQAYDAVAEIYDRSYGDPKSQTEDRVIFEMLREGRYLQGSVLDVGCGTGILVDEYPYLPITKYIGIDPSAEMLKRAYRKHPDHTFTVGSAEDVPVADCSVDTVVSLYGSFSYCLAPEKAVAEFMRVLRPGGRLFLMICGEPHAKRASYIMNKTGIEVERRLYTEAKLRRLFSRFSAVDVVGFGWALDHIPKSAPAWVFNAVMAVEMGTVGRKSPDLCCYQILTAVKSE